MPSRSDGRNVRFMQCSGIPTSKRRACTSSASTTSAPLTRETPSITIRREEDTAEPAASRQRCPGKAACFATCSQQKNAQSPSPPRAPSSTASPATKSPTTPSCARLTTTKAKVVGPARVRGLALLGDHALHGAVLENWYPVLVPPPSSSAILSPSYYLLLAYS